MCFLNFYSNLRIDFVQTTECNFSVGSVIMIATATSVAKEKSPGSRAHCPMLSCYKCTCWQTCHAHLQKGKEMHFKIETSKGKAWESGTMEKKGERAPVLDQVENKEAHRKLVPRAWVPKKQATLRSNSLPVCSRHFT